MKYRINLRPAPEIEQKLEKVRSAWVKCMRGYYDEANPFRDADKRDMEFYSGMEYALLWVLGIEYP